MEEESPTEKQERLERHEELMSKREERLQKQNERLHDKPPSGGSIGSGVGDFFSSLGEHKVLIVGAGVVILVGIVAYQFVNNNNSNASAGSANNAPDYAASGIMTSNISAALDSMNQELESLQQQQSTGTSANPSSSFQWPSALNGMKIWEGTTTHNFFYGPNGPQPGKAGQQNLPDLFPAGTMFMATNGGKAGGQLLYELPGSNTFQVAPVTLVNPVPSGLRTVSH